MHRRQRRPQASARSGRASIAPGEVSETPSVQGRERTFDDLVRVEYEQYDEQQVLHLASPREPVSEWRHHRDDNHQIELIPRAQLLVFFRPFCAGCWAFGDMT